MKRSLYFKFLIGYILFGIVGFIAVAIFSQKLTYNYLVRQNARKLYDEATLMAYSYEDSDYFKTDIENGLSSQLDMVSSFLNTRIWITNSSGRIIIDSDAGRLNGQTIADFDPAAGSDNYVIGSYFGLFDEEVMSVNAPISYNYAPIGYVILHLPMSAVLDSTNEILNIVYLTAAVIFILSLIILLIFTVFVFNPLRKITYAAGEYARGNLTYKIDLYDGGNGSDEIGYLAETLNYMARELNNTEEYQRNFIANVSHDFRSPLTSIKGFSEAMIDGTIPPELYPKYLERIISESERLNKLTYSMITLNSSDAKNKLNRSYFDINRTIKDVCAANENSCTRKNISFELIFEDEKEMVYADYAKIQQVLYNLVDNAIKFSNNGSAITISTAIKNRKVYVSVKDSGIGIPKDSIKKIWERFYKTDLSRGKDKTGTGLGLSIVKEIIQAHNESIDVISTENVGTEFIFSLPVSAPEQDIVSEG